MERFIIIEAILPSRHSRGWGIPIGRNEKLISIDFNLWSEILRGVQNDMPLFNGWREIFRYVCAGLGQRWKRRFLETFRRGGDAMRCYRPKNIPHSGCVRGTGH